MEERDGIAVETTRVPVVDGDDIVVVPAGPDDPGGPNARRLLVGIAIAAALAVVVALAIVARGSHSSSPAVRTSPTSISDTPIAAKPNASVGSRPKTVPVVAATTVPISSTPTTVAAVSPPASVASVPTTSPTPTTVAAPKQYGPSALTWTAPSSLTIAAGKTATLAVTAHNPTNGIVTLGHPLACTPHLDGGEMCTQTVQMIGPGQSVSAQYTIDANGFAPGHYTLKIEGVLTVAVTVS